MPAKKEMPEFPELIEETFMVLESAPDDYLNYNYINKQVCQRLQLDNKVIEEPSWKRSYSPTEIGRRCSIARTYLKKAGLIDNNDDGSWYVTREGKEVNPNEVSGEDVIAYGEEYLDYSHIKDSQKIQDYLHMLVDELTKEREAQRDGTPFERLTKILLDRMGFEDVKLTRRSYDHGADVKAVFKGNEVFGDKRVIFQCKHWNSFKDGEIDRKTMDEFCQNYLPKLAGDYNEIVFLTTGTFSQDARKVADSHGITLIDGLELTKLLIKYGVFFRQVEEYEIDPSAIRESNILKNDKDAIEEDEVKPKPNRYYFYYRKSKKQK